VSAVLKPKVAQEESGSLIIEFYSRHSRWHGPKDSICPECGAAFFDGKSFTRHEKVHKLSRDYFCGVGGCPCEQPGFSWKDHLTRQGETHLDRLVGPASLAFPS
jgi:uncharacterized Zn-finger protein